MELGLRGKKAWVLGASSGLGLAIATELSAQGARVAISSRSTERLHRAADSIPAVAIPLDVSDGREAIDGACAKVSKALSGLDIVIVNHGGPPPGGFDAVEDPQFAAAYELVLASAFRITKASVPYLRKAGGGVIVYVTSATTKEIIPDLFLSNTMRAGVVGMMKTFSHQLAADGIRLLCAAPGRISTDRATAVDAAIAQRDGRLVEEVRRSSEMAIPLGRYGRPSEFADVVTFLCSNRASYVTGCSVVVDGGKLLGLLT
jgi:3-oxoacyl-[acyl-carrier protein] reductase